MIDKSITVMVPAYNEEKYLETTVGMIHETAESVFKDYEIVIFDDYSSDRTGEIADELAKKNRRVRVIHNERNRGLGYNFRQGVKVSQKDYYCCIMADFDTSPDSIRGIFNCAGSTDLVLSYIGNDDRPLYRRVISKGFTGMLNLLFGIKAMYYCGIVIYNTESMKSIKLRTDSFAMQAEAIIQLVNKGASYKQVSYVSTDKGRTGESNVLKLKNIVGVLKTISNLFFEVHFKK